MVETDTGYLTEQGQKLFARMNSGNDSITYTRIVFSSDNLSNETEDQIRQTTNLESQEMSLTAQSWSDVDDVAHIRVVGNNQQTKEGFYVNTYGVFAKGNDGNEILYGISCDNNPAYITPYDNVSPQSLSYEWKLKVSRTDKINFDPTNTIYATIDDLNNAIIKEINNFNIDGINHNFTADLKYKNVEVATLSDTDNSIITANSYTDSLIASLKSELNDKNIGSNNNSSNSSSTTNNSSSANSSNISPSSASSNSSSATPASSSSSSTNSSSTSSNSSNTGPSSKLPAGLPYDTVYLDSGNLNDYFKSLNIHYYGKKGNDFTNTPIIQHEMYNNNPEFRRDVGGGFGGETNNDAFIFETMNNNAPNYKTNDQYIQAIKYLGTGNYYWRTAVDNSNTNWNFIGKTWGNFKNTPLDF